MSEGVQCFMIEPTGMVLPVASVMEGDHRAEVRFEPEVERYREYDEGHRMLDNGPNWDDVDWPTECECGEVEFTGEAFRSIRKQRQWKRPDTGETFEHPKDAGPGAMWDAHWMPSALRGATPDGRYLVVVLPNGREWSIDGSASNCTRPGEEHDCWCRHGDPPLLTVDKHPEPGRSTCDAGAGSIAAGDWHGFLRSGVLA